MVTNIRRDVVREVKVLIAGSRSYSQVDAVRGAMLQVWRREVARGGQFKLVFILGFESTRYGAGDRIVPGACEIAMDIISKGNGSVFVEMVEVPWAQVERIQPELDDHGFNMGRVSHPMFLWAEDVLEEHKLSEALVFPDGRDDWCDFLKRKLRESRVWVNEFPSGSRRYAGQPAQQKKG